MDFSILEEKLTSVAQLLNQRLLNLLPTTTPGKEEPLIKAMHYATLSKGKRIRPFLTVVTAQLFGVSLESALQTAVAIELIHSYSLVHDDLPSIDNDDFRRGQMSCHKKFGEAIALLAGDALLTLAFEILADNQTHWDPMVRLDLISCISKAAGYAGMVGGQAMDILYQNTKLDITEIVRLQRMKTGALFVISCEAGAILGKAPKALRNSLKAYANNLGLTFQIIDDLLDVEGDKDKVGKNVQKDQVMGKPTLISIFGPQNAKEHAKTLADQAAEYLAPLGEQGELLRTLCDYIIYRNR